MVNIQNGVVDVTLGGYIERASRFRNFGHTVTFLRDSVEWFITGDLAVNQLEESKALVVYSNLMIMFLCSVFMWFFKARTPAGRKYADSAWLLVWAMLVELPYQIAHLGARQRFLWMLLAFYFLVMNTLSKSLLTSVLSKPKFTRKINTIHDLVESNISIIYASPVERGQEFPGEVVNQTKLAPRVINCLELMCLRDRLAQEPLAVTAFSTAMRLVMKSASRTMTFHQLDKQVTNLQMTSYTRKHYFLLPTFRRQIRRFIEAGLVQFWLSEFERNPDCGLEGIKTEFQHRHSYTDQLEGLKVKRLVGPTGPIPLLLCGYSLASFFFICEVVKSYCIAHRVLFRLKAFFRNHCKREKVGLVRRPHKPKRKTPRNFKNKRNQ